jgi:hypothetical protein
MKPGQYGSSPEFRKNITNDEVLKFFAKNKHSEAVQLDVVENAMLPARFYYDEFTDHVRLWLNQASTTQQEVRETFHEELQMTLRKAGIDVRDRALT